MDQDSKEFIGCCIGKCVAAGFCIEGQTRLILVLAGGVEVADAVKFQGLQLPLEPYATRH